MEGFGTVVFGQETTPPQRRPLSRICRIPEFFVHRPRSAARCHLRKVKSNQCIVGDRANSSAYGPKHTDISTQNAVAEGLNAAAHLVRKLRAGSDCGYDRVVVLILWMRFSSRKMSSQDQLSKTSTRRRTNCNGHGITAMSCSPS